MVSNALKNEGRFPALITATCEYGRYDDTDKRSGGGTGHEPQYRCDRPLYNRTTGLLFLQYNLEPGFITTPYFRLYRQRYLTLGEIMKRTKNSSFAAGAGANINSRNFTLLGDPG